MKCRPDLQGLGKNLWGFETQEVVPDIIVLGKPMGNGHPMGAVVTTEKIAQSFESGVEFFQLFLVVIRYLAPSAWPCWTYWRRSNCSNTL
jgi:hypothetical protein